MRGGARICVPDTLQQITPYVLLEQEDWFEDEIRFVRRLLPPGGRAVDVGANYGIYTLALALAAGGRGRVWSFEPTPRTAEHLAHTLALNALPQVELLRKAVAGRSGTARFRVGEEAELNALADDGAAGAIEVPAASIDDLAREHAWDDIDFVKIDVEGHELEVVEGGKAFLQARTPLVMFEIAAAAGANLQPVRVFRALGYQLYRLVPGLGLLAPVLPGDSLDPYMLNLFCCKPDRARALHDAGLLAIGTEPSAGARAVPDDALSCFHAAMAPSADPDSRVWLLRRALDAANRELAADESLAGLMTYVRIARDFGERALAHARLSRASAAVQQRWKEALQVPFLAPDERFDAIARGDDAHAWFECALVETVIELGARSSLYVGPPLLALLDKLQVNPFRSPRTLRSRQLIRMRAGMQAGPEPHPLLTTRSDLNLNPEYWQNRAIIAPGGSP